MHKLQEYTPPADQTTLFRCTPDLTARLYPNPASLNIYVLNYVDNNATRVTYEPEIVLYDIGTTGYSPPTVNPCVGSIIFFSLNPSRMAKLVDSRGQTLWRIRFDYTSPVTAFPIVQKVTPMPLPRVPNIHAQDPDQSPNYLESENPTAEEAEAALDTVLRFVRARADGNVSEKIMKGAEVLYRMSIWPQ